MPPTEARWATSSAALLPPGQAEHFAKEELPIYSQQVSSTPLLGVVEEHLKAKAFKILQTGLATSYPYSFQRHVSLYAS